MQFFPKEPTIQAVCQRIDRGSIDLQPDFQRGEVWSTGKKQRLIDTILRGWIVPPILLVKTPDSPQQVLDGQQRLAAIRDFRKDKFAVDGRIEPRSPFIAALHGIRFSKLPKDVAEAFDDTALRIYEIAHYSPDEPAEIFFRLNQPAMLTSAEKRNAFFGPVRDEIRNLVERLKATPDFIQAVGFSNSRMAYDDVLARVAYLLESHSLRKKATEAAINAMYRRTAPLDDKISRWLARAVADTSAAIIESYSVRKATKLTLKVNKATLLSWTLFFSRLDSTGDKPKLYKFFDHFEAVRQGTFTSVDAEEFLAPLKNSLDALLFIFTDRSTSRVGDVNSILLRDFILWYNWYEYSGGGSASCTDPQAHALLAFRGFLRGRIDSSSNVEEIESATLQFLENVKWGEAL